KPGDYVVTLSVQQAKPSKPGQVPVQLLRKPSAPMHPVVTAAREMLVLPNSEPYVLCSSDFKMRSCNDLFCELCQLEENELLNQPLACIMDEESRAQFEADLHTLADTGTLANRDYFINPASGLEKIAVRLTGVKEEGGNYLFVLRNRTNHLQLVKVLEERSAQLNALLESTNGIVFSVLLNKGQLGVLDNVSQYLAQAVGFTQDELVHMQFKDLLVPSKETTALLARVQKTLAQQGKVSFDTRVLCKGGDTFEAQITLTALDLPGEPAALAVLRNLAAEKEVWAGKTEQAQELRSVRSSLPGLYVKTDSSAKALEVYSNLPYLTQAKAQELFIGKTPKQIWGKEAGQTALMTIKEALSMNVAAHFDLEWKLPQGTRYFEVSVTPISGRDEVVLWLKDISQGHTHQEQVRELYQITREPGLSITQQVDKILEFGLKTFRADVGFVLRFSKNGNKFESHIMYVTPNELPLERSMSFEVGECLYNVADGNVALWPDLSAAQCRNCVHIKKDFGSLVAAPLFVGNKVMGALCFASKTKRRSFETGAEELMGLLARLLSLRIELRQTGKMLNQASQAFARTLEYVQRPAAMIDLDYQITFINDALLEDTGRHMDNMMGRDFFQEIVRNDDLSKRAFKEEVRNAEGNSLRITLDIRTRKGTYEEKEWEVVLCKDDNGEVASYALLEVE
ncbi:MAG: PAS domain S-box protein, partial [Elusimicrobiaceae bacterium]|nr:PAS domain S-box protein [Elusimicrobiaceae bacterium]